MVKSQKLPVLKKRPPPGKQKPGKKGQPPKSNEKIKKFYDDDMNTHHHSIIENTPENPESETESVASETDLSYFTENMAYARFLDVLDEDALTKNEVVEVDVGRVGKLKNLGRDEVMSESGSEKGVLEGEKGRKRVHDDIEDELFDMSENDSDMDSDIGVSDLEILSDADSIASFDSETLQREPKPRKQKKNEDDDDLKVFEDRRREFSESEEEQVKSRMPVKVGGRWVSMAESDDEKENEENEIEKPKENPVNNKTDVKPEPKTAQQAQKPQKQQKLVHQILAHQKQQRKKSKDDNTEPQTLKPVSKAQLIQLSQDLALLAQSITQHPTDSIHQLAELGLYRQVQDSRLLPLALGTECMVYLDLIPGYRIRPEPESKGVKLSKEVRQRAEYEQTLLKHYHAFLIFLDELMKKQHPKHGVQQTNLKLWLAALGCMQRLLVQHPGFNYSTNLLTTLLVNLNLTLPDAFCQVYSMDKDEVARRCLESIETVLSEDEALYTSLEVVKCVSQCVKAKGVSKIHPFLLKCLLSLRLSSGDIDPSSWDKSKKKDKQNKKDKVHLSKKQKKYKKQMMEIEREWRESEASVSREERAQRTRQILEHVFICYSRVLKQGFTRASPGILKSVQTRCLGVTLEGLCRFGSFVNIEMVAELMHALRFILKEYALLPETNEENPENLMDEDSQSRLSLMDAYQLLVTLFRLQEMVGDALNLDWQESIEIGYRLLGQTPVRFHECRHSSAQSRKVVDQNNDEYQEKRQMEPKVHPEVELATRIRQWMHHLFTRQRSRFLSAPRLAAFLRRLSTLALLFSTSQAARILMECIQELLVIAPVSVHALMDTLENQHTSTASSKPLKSGKQRKATNTAMNDISEDIEGPHALEGGFWEWELSSRSWDPEMRQWMQRQVDSVLRPLVQGHGRL